MLKKHAHGQGQTFVVCCFQPILFMCHSCCCLFTNLTCKFELIVLSLYLTVNIQSIAIKVDIPYKIIPGIFCYPACFGVVADDHQRETSLQYRII